MVETLPRRLKTRELLRTGCGLAKRHAEWASLIFSAVRVLRQSQSPVVLVSSRTRFMTATRSIVEKSSVFVRHPPQIA